MTRKVSDQQARLLGLAGEIEKIERFVDLESKKFDQEQQLEGITRHRNYLDRASQKLEEARGLIARASLELS
jgi:hypothetical protein